VQQTDLNFRFKGARDYVHGTDMFNQTLSWLCETGAEPRDIDFAFHRIARRQLAAGPAAPEGAEPVAVCNYTSGGERLRIVLVERGAHVTERYPYPEDEIVSAMAVDATARRGVLRGATTYSDVELAVAMTKALHQRVFGPATRWLFVRARFPQYTRQSQPAERAVAIVASFHGKLTRTEVAFDGAKVGEIHFSPA
jgi:hypothetical protein